MATNSIILLLVLSISCLCSTRDVHILPSERDYCPGTPCYNITTFGKMADSFSNSSGLVVHFLKGTHLLDLQEVVVFNSLNNAVFEGDRRIEQGFHETVWQSTVVIKCTEHSSTGIAFANSSNITVRYITITGCRGNMTGLYPAQLRENVFTGDLCNNTLGFFLSGNIMIDKISIHSGSGSSLMIAMDGYDLTITNSLFAHNQSSTDCSTLRNVAVFYIDPLNCASRQHSYNTLIANTNVTLLGEGNKFINRAGIFMFVSQRSYKVDIVLDFVSVYGAGLPDFYHDNIYILSTVGDVATYRLTINNSVSSNTNGYGLFIAVSIFETTSQFEICTAASSRDSGLVIVIENCSFTYNRKSGIHLIFLGTDYSPNIMIYSSEVSHNFGQHGISIVSYSYQSQFFVTLQNIVVDNNDHPDSNSHIYPPSTDQYSAVHAEFVTILVLNNVSITNNNMTGLTVYNSAITVNRNSTSIFHNNTGIDGGGLAMYGNSYLVFQEYSLLNFTNNKAKHRGGAIFVDSSTQYIKFACFFQYSSHDPKIQSAKAILSGNKADVAGSVLFGGEIYSCSLYSFTIESGSKYFHKIFNYSTQTGPSVISSEPTDVCFCDDNNTINCSQTQLTMEAYPGEEINISVVTTGQEGGVTPGIVEIKSAGDAMVLQSSQLFNTSAMINFVEKLNSQ